MILNGHLYLCCEWLGVDLRMDTKKTCVEREYSIEFINHCRQNSQLDWGDLYNHLLTQRIFTLTTNRIFEYAPKLRGKWI